MTQFRASLIASGDPEPLPTTIDLDQGKLSLASNGQALGDWSLSELEFERIVGGFRVKLDGEVAVLKLAESDQFGEELVKHNVLEPAAAKPKAEKRPKAEKKAKEKKVTERRATATKAPERPRDPSPSDAAAKQDSFLVRLDGWLEKAAAKWDRYLPGWVFTRGGVAVGVILLLAMLIFRDVFSTILLIVAAIGLITSAIALLDQVIATRIFRKGFTPIHGLIGSLCLVLVALVLAAI